MYDDLYEVEIILGEMYQFDLWSVYGSCIGCENDHEEKVAFLALKQMDGWKGVVESFENLVSHGDCWRL